MRTKPHMYAYIQDKSNPSSLSKERKEHYFKELQRISMDNNLTNSRMEGLLGGMRCIKGLSETIEHDRKRFNPEAPLEAWTAHVTKVLWKKMQVIEKALEVYAQEKSDLATEEAEIAKKVGLKRVTVEGSQEVKL